MRFIDADKLKDTIESKIENDNNEDFDKGYNIALQGIIEEIDNAPTVIYCSETPEGLPLMDLRERPKGEWIGLNEDCRGYCDSFKCSECGALIYPNCVQRECDYPACPYCLADMRGDTE